MTSHFRPACLALALAVTAGPACAQTWVYESGERIVTETTAPRVVTRPAVGYAYRPAVTEAYALAPAPAPRVVARPLAVDYGPRVTESYALAPLARPVVSVPVVRPYRYINNRLLVVDPVTGDVVGEIND